MKPLLIAGFALAASVLGQEEAAPPPVAVEAPAVVVEPPPDVEWAGAEFVTSRTGQFRIGGGDGVSRGSIAMLAEETSDDLLKLTEEKDSWKIPIRVVLHGQQGDPLPARTVAMDLIASDAGYELQLQVHLSRGVERERFQRAATQALIYERGLRSLPLAERDTALRVPPWLVEGLREASDWHYRATDRRLYEVLFKKGGLYTLEQLFAVDEAGHEAMDAAMRAAFRVSAGSLVMALLEQPQGKDAFRSFLGEVAPFAGEMPALLRKHFPELNLSETSLAKWWQLQMANKGTLDSTQVFTIARTETALNEALRLNYRAGDGTILEKPLSAWEELAELEIGEREASVRLAEDALVRLSYRCFPSYRPLIADYQAILAAVARDQTKGVAARLGALEETRSIMIEKAARARDFLDWFEITRARETSGAFDDYLRLKDQLKFRRRGRSDDLSKYLDRIDEIFYRETDQGGTGIQP